MSARRNNAGRIRGPQSALTDFLASQNISAQQIRETFEQRQRNAQQANAAAATAAATDAAETEDVEVEESAAVNEFEVGESSRNSRKRKREAGEKAKAKEKLKAVKKKKGGDDSDDDYDDLRGEMYKKQQPVPGQLENCELCDKRFTVTPYSKNGPDGGLLCPPCGKKMTKDNKATESKSKKAGTGRKRRQQESNRLDGLVHLGAKSLQHLCIEKVATHHTDIDELGDMPDNIVDRLSQIFSKKRVMDPHTLPLFLRPDLHTVAIHDAAKLDENDFKQIFAVAPHASKLVLRNAGQFKDSVMDYMIEKAEGITDLQLYGANLISNEMWIKYFETRGHELDSLKIQHCDASFNDEVVDSLITHCQNLRRLKLKDCRKVTPSFLTSLAKLQRLEHVSLRLATAPQDEELISLIIAIGPRLRTLSLENCPDISDPVVNAIAKHCQNLNKLRLSGIECVSDATLAGLFSTNQEQSVLPPLTTIDLTGARDVDYSNPEGPEENPVGLASASFTALMNHSASKLRSLAISSCRHIPHSAFGDVFRPDRGSDALPALESLDISFCAGVDTSIIRGIFATCPMIKRIIAFGCFRIEEVLVPAGVAVIGVPRAQDAIENVGMAGVDVNKALDFMGGMISPVGA